jgi:hypothetical protein
MLGANRLMGTTNAPVDDYFLGNILGISLKKVFRKFLKDILKLLCTILLRFLLIFFQKMSYSNFSKSIYKFFTT